MPYIDPERRTGLWEGGYLPQNVGELNYLISLTCKTYMINEGLSYKSINDVIGVLECVKQEFYRRIAVPYEDKKIEQNGDIY